MRHALTVLLLLSTAAPACADVDVAAFYKDKQIRLVVGSAAGSGYDIGARLLARHLQKHIPGNPSFVIQNQPGAASVTMTNSVYNVGAKDGTVMGAAINGMPTAPLLEPEGVRFDPTKLIWIGSVNREVQATYVWHTAPVQSLADLYKKELIVGATTPGTTQVDFPKVARSILGLKYKVISGYPGTAQIHKAMEAGEVQGVGSTAYASLLALAGNLVKEGKIKVIAQWGFKKHPDLPGVPAILDEAKNDLDRQALSLLIARLEYGRPFFLPPGVPEARVAAIRKAFDETMKDPEFIEEALKLKLEVDPMSGNDVAELVSKVSATPPDIVKRVRAALQSSSH
jgi:tripartite-type tricarboxylate transporter receptor subunit TctC